MADGLYRAIKTVLTPLADVYFELRASGHELLSSGPFILAANHASLLDWVFVARFVTRPVRFVLTREFFDQRALSWAYRRLGVIPIRDGAIELSAVRQLLTTLRRGEIVGVFPEGRITRDGALAPGEPGVITIAARAGVAIVPVGVHGAFEAFPRDAWFPRPRPIRVHFGTGLPIPRSAATDRDEQRHLLATLMREIAALRATAAAGDQRPAHRRAEDRE
ncbi:MAG: 1-acyl-sn-glycerol-3-phosphate acyltransferase [Deltaproteobacteria bacterium]|nr:1-acyl-sn-glycerol-3-phosphate acyltransferase [Deltaproteobacteria bacterium]